jgi:exonuclease SbcC
MASLSGGESFLVSLALALGLSDLAGRTVRIDSLFIDEGFGSLDPDTLEVAIAALESLRQNHKKVGVISHVGLLKERIGTQIVVEKQAGGVSRIRVVA